MGAVVLDDGRSATSGRVTARCTALSPARSPSPGAVTAAPSLGRALGADGSVRRCTAVTAVFAGACVSALRRGATGGAGVTRGPVAGAGATGADCGAHATGTAPETEAGPAAVAEVTDRWAAGATGLCPLPSVVGSGRGTGAVAPPRRPANGTRCTTGPAPEAPVVLTIPAVAEPTEPAAPVLGPLPTARSGTTGSGGPGGLVGPANGMDCMGRSRPDEAPAAVRPVRPPLARDALDSPSRTACERGPRKEGFCQVGSRPPKPGSATGPPVPSARWIGGSPGQAAATTGRGGSSAETPGSTCVSGARSRPRTRSHSPTAQPSAPAEAARVTRDAISAV
ncbi:hypothetical protein ABZX77_33370 [Streptomyces sp. NPDC004237]|uniref:hypothetical protein n=1 Tax=Streptomyces sp. NPDC004237 TaxID=3154455 RepID=UPI00339EF05E